MGAVARGVLAAVGAAVLPGTAAPAAAAVAPVPPNLRQLAPAGFRVTPVAGAPARFRLGFSSTTINVGLGPLRIESRRVGDGMASDQVVRADDGTQIRRAGIGRLAYVRGGGHEHWHLREFVDYELSALDSTRGRRIVKTGFCLGDRRPMQDVDGPAQPSSAPVYRHQCGRRRPGLTRVTMGISTGYTDIYSPFVHGQSFSLTGLAAGLYVLTHTVNASGALLETDYGDNASSTLLRLQRPRGAAPRVVTLRRCPLQRTCPPLGRTAAVAAVRTTVAAFDTRAASWQCRRP